jgi:hypothetical protein
MKENASLNIKPSRHREFGVRKPLSDDEEVWRRGGPQVGKAQNDSVFTMDYGEEVEDKEVEVESGMESEFELYALSTEALHLIQRELLRIQAKQEADSEYSPDDEPLSDEMAHLAEELGLTIRNIDDHSIELFGPTEHGFSTSKLYTNSDYLEFLAQVLNSHSEEELPAIKEESVDVPVEAVDTPPTPVEVDAAVHQEDIPNETASSIPPELPDDALKAMDAVRERTREELKNKVEAEDAGHGPSRGGNKPRTQKVSDVKVKHETKTEEPVDATFDSRFNKEFGITKEDLIGINGFENLSLSQQKLVFENLKEYAERGADGYRGAVWSGIKGAFGNKGEGVPRKGSKGMEAYGEVLKTLVYGAEKYGPKVHEENGELRPDFVGMQFDREHRKEQKEAVDNLNQAAHAFARVPAEWQNDGNGVHANEWKITSFFKEKVLKTESRMHYKEFEEKQRAFETMKQQFATELEATGVPRAEIIKKLIEIDGQVHNLRTLETNPEVAETLHGVRDESVWKKAGSMIAQGAIYGGIGAVGRMATAHVLQFMGSPLVAASLAGTRSWNKVAAEQRERDRKARLGVVDGSDTALNIVQAAQEVEISGEKRDVGVTQKLHDSIEEVTELMSQIENAKEKSDVDATSYFQEKLDKKLESLKARVSYSYDKLKLNRIQFGDKENFAMNQARFFETLAQAQILIAEQEVDPSERTEERLQRYLSYREGAINDRRHHEQFKKVAIAASTAAAFSLAGALAVEEYKTGGVSEKLKEWFGRSSASFSPAEGLLDAELGNRNTTVPYEYTETSPSGANQSQGEIAPQSAREGLRETYSIKRGDTLIKIVQSELPLKTPDGKPLSEGAVLRLLKELTPAELEKIGVEGGNIDRIYAGKNLNLEELNKALFAHAGGGVQTEDLGDFKGAQHELDSDALNKAAMIKEMEVTMPDVGEMADEYPSGEAVMESPKPAEAVDLITEKKAKILQDYFFKVNNLDRESAVWKILKNEETADWFNKAYSIPKGVGYDDESIKEWKRLYPLRDVLDYFRQPPIEFKPYKGETVEKYTQRVFSEIARKGEGQFPQELRRLLNHVDRNGPYT